MSDQPELPDDRELEEFLSRRSDISRVYRSEAEEPAPAALDAPVLAAAAVPVARVRRLQRWRVPVTLAASLVMVFGLLRFAVDEPIVREPALRSTARSTAGRGAGSEALAPAPVAGEATAEPGPEADRDSAARPAPPPASATIEHEAPAAPPDDRKPEERQKKAAAAEAGQEAERSADRRARDEAAAKREAAEASSARAERSGQSADAVSSIESLPPPPPPPPIVELEPSASGEAVAKRPASIPQTASARAGTAAPTPSEKADAAVPPSALAAKVPDDVADTGWHSGRYQGLALGRATQDDVIRRFGTAPIAERTHSDQPLPDGRVKHRLLEYPERVDPRGSVRLYFDANSQALALATITLKPALPLAEIEAQESLTPPVLLRAADTPLCAPDAVRSSGGDASAYPQYRVYPKQGVYLLLTAVNAVSEISYFERCN